MPNPSPVPEVEPLPVAKTPQVANGSDANNSAATHLPVNEAERPLGHRPILKGSTSQNPLKTTAPAAGIDVVDQRNSNIADLPAGLTRSRRGVGRRAVLLGAAL
ncbi:hypothetical protein NL676_005202 [Syzygium grande]|nr:hypothetical protein NL676_005202 [Syzygium grande]